MTDSGLVVSATVIAKESSQIGELKVHSSNHTAPAIRLIAKESSQIGELKEIFGSIPQALACVDRKREFSDRRIESRRRPVCYARSKAIAKESSQIGELKANY